MREKILSTAMINIKNKYPEYNDNKLEEISYGLEALYITFTKTIVIFGISLVLNIFKEVLCILLCYNIIRTTAFGMHAKKSWHCYLISISVFVGGALLCKYVDINIYIKIVLSLIAFVCMILYAPADTYKRPLINAKKRKIYKIFSIIISFIYVIIIFTFEDKIISDYLFMGLLAATMMIHPFTYRVFQLPYDNYKTYDVSNY